MRLFFLSPLSFFFFSSFFFSHIFILYSLLCSAWAILLLFFVSLLFCTIVDDVCQFLRRLAMLKRHPHPQCLPVSCPSTPYPSWLLHLLPRIAVAGAGAGAGGESPARNELIQIQSHTVESAGYNVLIYSFILSFPLLVPLYWILSSFCFSLFQFFSYLHSTHTHFVFGIFLRKTMQNFSLLRIPGGICTYIVYIYVYVYLIFRKPQSRYENGHRLRQRHFEVVVRRPHRTAPCVLWRLVLTVLIRNPRKLAGKTLLKVMKDTRRG